MKTGTDTVGLDYNPILADITAKVIMTPTVVIPGHTAGITDDITGVVHDTHTQPLTHIILTVTLHIADLLHIEALQLTPEITADHTLNQHTNPPGKVYTNLLSHSQRPQGKTPTKRNSRVTIDDPQTDYYSSDDHSSDSEEDSDHLN